MRVHYKNLNSVRCVAAILVIISHIEQVKKDNGLTNYWTTDSLIFLLSKIGVALFFVLSGFLITSLLFVEKEQYKTISIKSFYLKRILRIWPLYFLIVGLSLFLFPHISLLHFPSKYWNDGQTHLWGNILLFIFFLPNLQALIYGSVMFSGQTWSIGVEEQYYLFWPWIMKKVGSIKTLKIIILSLISFFIVLKIALSKVVFIYHKESLNLTLHFLKRQFPIHTILIGCYFAVLNNNERIRALLTKKIVQATGYILLVLCLISQSQFKGFYWEVYACIFGLILLNLVNKSSIINLEFKPIAYLGKISYGMYMYHIIFVTIIVRAITTNNVLIYILSFALTILVSAISFELFEKRLLNLKERLSRVKSG